MDRQGFPPRRNSFTGRFWWQRGQPNVAGCRRQSPSESNIKGGVNDTIPLQWYTAGVISEFYLVISSYIYELTWVFYRSLVYP